MELEGAHFEDHQEGPRRDICGINLKKFGGRDNGGCIDVKRGRVHPLGG
jgi:hypothetical protein